MYLMCQSTWAAMLQQQITPNPRDLLPQGLMSCPLVAENKRDGTQWLQHFFLRARFLVQRSPKAKLDVHGMGMLNPPSREESGRKDSKYF